MYDDEKVWAIDLGEDLEVMTEDPPSPETPAPVEAKPKPSRVLVRRMDPPGAKAGKSAPRRLHFALLVPLTFLLGPGAIALTPEGRRRKDWLSLGLVLMATWGTAPFWIGPLLDRMGHGVLLVAFLVLAAAVCAMGFTVWARAVHLAGRNRPANHRLPRWLTRTGTTAALGFLAPGMGLLAAGRNRRAAGVLWLTGLPVAASLVLLSAPRYWPAVRTGDLVVDPLLFEKIVLGAAGLAAVGLLGWLVQALEGARLVQLETGTPRSRRGDLYGLALLGAVAALFALAEPAPVARYLGREARSLRAEGLRLTPLVMVRTATVLDPGRTDYTVTALEILDAMGRPRPAAEIRSRLEDDLASYLEMVRREEERQRELRRRAELEAAAQAAFPMGWFAPDPFAMTQKDPEDGSAGSR